MKKIANIFLLAAAIGAISSPIVKNTARVQYAAEVASEIEDAFSLIDEAINVAGVSTEKAVQKYIQAQEIILDDCPAIMVYCDEYIRPYRKNIIGYKDNPGYPETVFFYDLHKQ